LAQDYEKFRESVHHYRKSAQRNKLQKATNQPTLRRGEKENHLA